LEGFLSSSLGSINDHLRNNKALIKTLAPFKMTGRGNIKTDIIISLLFNTQKGEKHMNKLLKSIIPCIIILTLLGCGSSGAAALKLTVAGSKFEKTEYTAKNGSTAKIIMDAPDLLSIEIKGLELKLDKKQKNKVIEFKNVGIYDIIGNAGNGKLIKSKLTVE
jgi:hypothetical protein